MRTRCASLALSIDPNLPYIHTHHAVHEFEKGILATFSENETLEAGVLARNDTHSGASTASSCIQALSPATSTISALVDCKFVHSCSLSVPDVNIVVLGTGACLRACTSECPVPVSFHALLQPCPRCTSLVSAWLPL